ncbi:3'-5' exonuclease [Litchfieldia alkalitelluris]|uniref:3'-5' exonuclease n=1 Tax=Litchfieldia alkalitelluris TaxID=304268 RepID=UPI000996DA59|nr:exonuclease domain-containing protein [Litchfieldia alkalitelluris]
MPVDIKILHYYLWKQFMIKYKLKQIRRNTQNDLHFISNNTIAIEKEKDLSAVTFTVFDLETTGFFPELGDEVLSVGAVKIRGGEILRDESFYKVVRPIDKVPHSIKQLTGLTDKEINSSHYFPWVLKKFIDFSQETVLVAHPASFDIPFLQSTIKTWGLPDFSPEVIDSHALANWIYPDNNNFLDQLVEYYQIDQKERHHALNDAIMTAEIFIKLINETDQLLKYNDLLEVTRSI